jgi:hypothetical protein
MILLKELFEAKPKITDFSAISKETGKLVYFDTKNNMDAAIKAGTHDNPKVKGNDIETPKSSDLFKGDYEKERGGTIDKKINTPPKPKKVKYTSDEAKPIDTIFSKMKNWYGGDTETKYNKTPEDIANFANKHKIDINRILTKPEKFIELNGRYNRDGQENMTDTEYVVTQLGRAMVMDDAWNPNGSIASVKSAYPLKYKGLSDDEIEAQIKQNKESKDKVAIGLKVFSENENKIAGDIDKINKYNKKIQSDWVKNALTKDIKYPALMEAYQVDISKKALGRIDEMLKADPPPPIKANALYRGMAMKPKDFKSFLGNFSEGKNIKLPISSFSLDPSLATDFADNVNNGNTLLGEDNNQSVMIKVVNKNNSFNGFSMNSNVGNFDPYKVNGEWDIEEYEYQQEVLMPSNNNYKVVKVETKNMEDDRTLTIINLEQIDSSNEIKLREFIDDAETDILKKHLQYPNRKSLLYTKEGEN